MTVVFLYLYYLQLEHLKHLMVFSTQGMVIKLTIQHKEGLLHIFTTK